MLNINFVPDDYIQNKESCRTNLLYSVLFLIVMGALAAVFVVVKARNERLTAREESIDKQLASRSQALEQIEELEKQSNKLLDKAYTVSGLIEPVPRSVLLAVLTNNLPDGTSLLEVGIKQQEEERKTLASALKNKAGKKKQTSNKKEQIPQESSKIELRGQAVSDLQVARYIQELELSSVLGDVKLVESVEYEAEDKKFRAFRLKINVKSSVRIDKEDIKRIAADKSLSM